MPIMPLAITAKLAFDRLKDLGSGPLRKFKPFAEGALNALL